jgi:hypothetical protein
MAIIGLDIRRSPGYLGETLQPPDGGPSIFEPYERPGRRPNHGPGYHWQQERS